MSTESAAPIKIRLQSNDTKMLEVGKLLDAFVLFDSVASLCPFALSDDY